MLIDYGVKGKEMNNTENIIVPHFFRFYCLMLLTLTLLQGLGCSQVPVKKSSAAAERETCDLQADTAMRLEAYETSIRFHLQFIEKEPENELALYHLGFSYGQTGNHEKEVFYYEKAISLGFKKDQIFFNLGMALGEINQFDKAIDAFKEGLTLNPSSTDNHFGLGLTYQKVGKETDAEMALLKAIEFDPENLDARFYLSLLYADMKNFQKARQQLRQILEIDPSFLIAQDLLESIEMEEEGGK